MSRNYTTLSNLTTIELLREERTTPLEMLLSERLEELREDYKDIHNELSCVEEELSDKEEEIFRAQHLIRRVLQVTDTCRNSDIRERLLLAFEESLTIGSGVEPLMDKTPAEHWPEEIRRSWKEYEEEKKENGEEKLACIKAARSLQDFPLPKNLT